MSKSHHPQRLAIRLLALHLECGTLSAEEKALLARALRVMADGGGFEEALGVKRRQGRPKSDRALYGVQRVATLMLEPSGAPFGDLGGEGLTKAAAFKRVAGDFKRVAGDFKWVAGELSITPDMLDTAYKSKRGQAVRKQVKEADQVVREQVAQGGGG